MRPSGGERTLPLRGEKGHLESGGIEPEGEDLPKRGGGGSVTALFHAATWETGRMTGRDRDRDTEGRARQARPRDALGRPLPYGTVGVEPVSEEPLPPEDTLAAARDLVGAGRPFSAHEVLEARWKAGPVEERDLWQGLAQVCVAMTHAARGNQVGADRLFDRAAQRLTAFAETGRWAYGLDLDAVAEHARNHVGTL